MRLTRLWEPDSSGEEVLFIRTRDGDTQVDTTMRDVGVQTMTWQCHSSDELESEIASRLSYEAFTMIDDHPVHLRPDYSKRRQYKLLGATYNGTTQIWSLMLGCDLRHVLTIAPGWIENAGLLRRRILLRMIQELGQGADFT